MNPVTDGANVNAAVNVPQEVSLFLKLILKVKGKYQIKRNERKDLLEVLMGSHVVRDQVPSWCSYA